jgi:PDZ domain/Alpha/beta hydrolase family
MTRFRTGFPTASARRSVVWLALVGVVGGLVGAAPLSAKSTLEGSLPRRAQLGFDGREVKGGLVVANLRAGSAAAQAGLAEGDRIVAINGQKFAKDYIGGDLLRRLDGGEPVTLLVAAGGNSRTVAFAPPALPLEQLDGADTLHGVLDLPDGSRLRTLVTRPLGASAPLPAIFVTQWVSCDSIEMLEREPWLDVLRGVAERSGMVMIRVERTSGGDSEGPGCHELDYDTEVEHYRWAFDRLTRSPWVDPERVVIWGNSLGGTTAPLVAAGRQLAGIVVSGGGALTFFERMLAFDRIGFERGGERGGLDPREVDERMRRHAEFHVEYLLRRRDPAAIVKTHPHLAEVWSHIRGSGDGVHYGRPYAYHQQAAARNFLAAWAETAAPVLALFCEYDQFEMANGHRVIVDTLNRLRPGSARYVELPNMGHSYQMFATAVDAAAWRRGLAAAGLAVEPILQWLRELRLAVPEAASDR